MARRDRFCDHRRVHTVTGDDGAEAAGGQSPAAALASFVRRERLPGAAAGVVCDAELAWSGAVGFADVAARRASEPGTLYRIASITKTFTGTAIMRLRDAGLLGLDDPAIAWLPELRDASSPHAPIEAVTIRRMLSHEAGLAAEPPGTDWAVPTYQGSAAQTLRHARDIRVTLPPNAHHKYSDLAYQLLGEIVTRVTGIPYDRYLREAVLDPLGMAATGFEPLPAGLPGRRAAGYAWRALSDEFEPAPAMPPVWAEGGLWSCVSDLATWIAFQLRAHAGPAATPATDAAVLAAATLREMHRPRYLADDGWTQAWGIAWCGKRRGDVTWIGHSGGLPGFTTAICFDPGTQVGAVVLLNGTCGGLELGIELAAAARRRVLARPPVIAPPEPVPARYRPLLGIYARPGLGGWVLRLEWRDGELAFTSPEAPGWRAVVRPDGDPDLFVIEAGPVLPAEQVLFRRTPGGRVASVLLAETTWLRLDPVTGG
jgi:CubicO group peptidase (beta-lactamase class C family)